MKDASLDEAPLLAVKDLSICFASPAGPIPAVTDVSLTLGRGETLGLVGESGSGKSTLALSLAGLLPAHVTRIPDGTVRLDGQNLIGLDERAMQAIRGASIGFIFQDPMTSLNPTTTIGRQIEEPFLIHGRMGRKAARDEALALLSRVGIPDPKSRVDQYPFEMSGGQRQRVMIAIALACRPRLLIADEPTTALDVTIQAQILDLIRALSEEEGMAVLLITHDLGVAARMCDRVGVMYAGQLVETGPVEEVFYRSAMPYARGLLEAIPRMTDAREGDFRTIPGQPPSPLSLPRGCRFAPRCPKARDICRTQAPAFLPRTFGHFARCWGTETGGWIE